MPRPSALCTDGHLSDLLLRVHFDEISVLHPANGVVRPRDHLVAGLKPSEYLEVLVAGDADLDGHELGAAVPDHENAFGFLARLPGLELGGSGDRFDRAARPLVISSRSRLLH